MTAAAQAPPGKGMEGQRWVVPVRSRTAGAEQHSGCGARVNCSLRLSQVMSCSFAGLCGVFAVCMHAAVRVVDGLSSGSAVCLVRDARVLLLVQSCARIGWDGDEDSGPCIATVICMCLV